MKKSYLLFALLTLPALAFAATGAPPNFDEFNQVVLGWATGPLGTGLAVTMLLMGGAVAVAQNTPMPALTGVAGAAFLHFGPGIIMSITGVGPVDAAPTQTAQVVAAASPNAASAAILASAAIAASSATPASVTTVATAPAPQSASSTTASEANAVALTEAQPKKALASDLQATASGVAARDTSSLTAHSASLAHTVPVPTATPAHTKLKSPEVSSSQLTKWVGLGGGAIILTLLGLLALLSAQRRARSSTGFSPSGSASASTSVFQDPHGFQREKRSPTFGHESP